MAWWLVKHRDNFTFTTVSFHAIQRAKLIINKQTRPPGKGRST